MGGENAGRRDVKQNLCNNGLGRGVEGGKIWKMGKEVEEYCNRGLTQQRINGEIRERG